MHKCFIIVILLLFYFSPDVFAQNDQDIIYLKNGRKLTGKIIELIPDVSVTIKTNDGATLTYDMVKVLRIDKKRVKEEEKVFKEKIKNFRDGFIMGGGIGFYSYTTSWYYSESAGNYSRNYHYPWHIFSRQQIILFLEKQSLFRFGSFHLDLKFDLHYEISGGTEEDWLPSGESISAGGATYATSIIFNLAYPLKTTSAYSISPYAGIGFQFVDLVSDGEGVGTEFANRTSYYYEEGWEEHIYGMILPMGIEFEIKKFIIIAEYRIFLFGGADTDWDPTGSEVVEEDGPSFGGFSIEVGFKF